MDSIDAVETIANWTPAPLVAGRLSSTSYGLDFKITEGGIMSLGRNATCDFRLPTFFDKIEELHCVVQARTTSDGRRFLVSIMNRSTSGTFLNGFALPKDEWKTLSNNATIYLGGTARSNLALHFYLCPRGSLESEFNRYEELGSGTFGVVHRWQNRLTGAVLAIKRIKYDGNVDAAYVERELQAHQNLEDPHILQFYGHRHESDAIYFMLEYAPYGNIAQYMHKSRGMHESTARTVTLQTARALAYMHERFAMAHRDVKPQNTLVAELDPLRVKLADFGFAKTISGASYRQTMCGTPCYYAPEVIAAAHTPGSNYDTLVDSWSLGVMLFEMLSAKLPFEWDEIVRTHKNKTEARNFSWTHWPADATVLARQVVAGLCHPDPAQRMSMHGLLHHEWATAPL